MTVTTKRTPSSLPEFVAAGAALSRGQQRVVAYLCENYGDAVFLTAGQIAGKLGLSTSTVTRLAPALGYDGFRALQQAFRGLVRAERSTVSRLEAATTGGGPGRDTVTEIFAADLENLRRTHAEVDHAALRRAADAILGAERVFVIGLRSSHAVAVFLDFALGLVLGTSRLLVPGIGNLAEQASTIGRRDAVIAVSVARYTRQTYEILVRAKARGASTIVITDKVTSPLAPHGDAVLLARTHLGSFVESFVAPLSVGNALVTLVATRRRRGARKRLAEFEHVWKEEGLYV